MSTEPDRGASTRAEEALADYVEACEAGAPVDPAAFAARYAGVEADVAELIREYVAVAERLARRRRED